MIDIHSHILFGVDDGARGLDDSLDLARIYTAAGYRQVVATPHAMVDALPSNHYGKTIRGLVNRLNNYLEARSVPLTILPGMEVGLDPLLPLKLSQGAILTLADTNYLLVETPFGRLPLNWWEVVFALATRGTRVIFAHPERCSRLAEKPELLDKMAQSGAKFQMNWDSFSGAYGGRVAKLARFMARKGFVHCLATDSHDPDRRNAGNVRALWSELKVLVGEANLKRIAVDNPARLIQGKDLLDIDLDNMPDPVRQKKRMGIMGLVDRVTPKVLRNHR